MRVYLDMCAIQRPLDDRGQLRILVEAEAVLGVIGLCESGEVELVASDALILDGRANGDPARRDAVFDVLAAATAHVMTSDDVEQRAEAFVGKGLKPLDALHLALAVEAEADYFCTSDDRLLRKARSIDTGRTETVSPLELIEELEP